MRRPVASASAGRWTVPGLVLVLVLVLGGLLTGCEPGGGVPGIQGSALPGVPKVASAMAIGLVMPGEGVQAASVYEQILRHEGSRAGVVVEVIQSEPGQEAEAVREMALRGVKAMVVVPAPDEREAVGSAVAEARDGGVPAVLLERDAPAGETPLPLIAFTSLDELADRLVAEALKAAREEGYPETVKAVVLVNGPFDEVGREKVAALHRALERAKVNAVPDLNFEGFQKEARAVLDPVLKADPEVGIVLGVEDQAIMTAADLRDQRDAGERRFVYAGFANGRDTSRMTEFGLSAGVAYQSLPKLAKRAYDVAVDLAAGKPLPQTLVVETPVMLPQGEEREGFFARATPAEMQQGFVPPNPDPKLKPKASPEN